MPNEVTSFGTVRLLVTGARGFIGRHLLHAAKERGHTSVATSRDASDAVPDAERTAGWDPASGPAPADAFQGGIDAVVHLAGESVGEGRWTKRKMARIRASRELGTRHLVEGIAALPAADRPKVLVNSSAIGYYGCHGDDEITEATEPVDDFLAEVARVWEAEATKAEAHGLRVVRIRTGIVLGTDGGALPRMLTPFKWFVGGPIGRGAFWWSWIHVEDLVALYLRALESDGWTGAYNATAPNPVTNRDFSKAVGAALGRPSFMPAPPFMLRIMIGRFARFLTCSQKVLPKRALERGFEFRHPDLAGALRSLLRP